MLLVLLGNVERGGFLPYNSVSGKVAHKKENFIPAIHKETIAEELVHPTCSFAETITPWLVNRTSITILSI
jgi:hypothetical protein